MNQAESQYDYDYHMVLAGHLLGQTFHSMIMAAMIRGDTTARRQLAYAFPEVADDLRDRGHPEIPPGRPEPGDQTRPGALVSPGADALEDDPFLIADQVREAMGGVHHSWAPAVLEIVRLRYPDCFADAVSTAFAQNQLKESDQ